MRNAYTYGELWPPQGLQTFFRMWQLNLDGHPTRLWRGYWENSPIRFV